MKLLLGYMLNIYENKNFVRNSFFGVVQKPKFKHKKGGGGDPNSKVKKLIRTKFTTIIYLYAVQIWAL